MGLIFCYIASETTAVIIGHMVHYSFYCSKLLPNATLGNSVEIEVWKIMGPTFAIFGSNLRHRIVILAMSKIETEVLCIYLTTQICDLILELYKLRLTSSRRINCLSCRMIQYSSKIN